MQLVLFLTLVEVAFGMALVHLFVRRSALGLGFAKTISSMIFFCVLLPTLLAGPLLPGPDSPLLGAMRNANVIALAFWFAYFVVLNYDKPKAEVPLSIAATAFQGIGLFLVCRFLAIHFVQSSPDPDYGPSVAGLTVALTTGVFASALVLGTVSMALMIGHWYLVIPGLAMRWLKGSCLAFGAAIAVKVGAIAVSTIIGVRGNPYGAQGFFDDFRTDQLGVMFVLARLLVGVGLPILMCFMAYRAAAIRSTQSSTGILFPATIFAFFGEMIGSFLIIGFAGLCM